MDPLDYKIEQLDNRACGDLLELTNCVGWDYSLDYWRVILSSGRVYGLVGPDRDLIGCTAIFDYGPTWAAIGVVVVKPDYQGKGFSTRLMDTAVAGLGPETPPLTLISTPEGLPVYKSRGFEQISKCSVLVRPGEASAAPPPQMPGYRFRPVSEDNIQDVISFDREMSGVDRSQVLYTFQSFWKSAICLYEEATGAICGYAFSYERPIKNIIGPVVATTADQAVALVQMLIYGQTEPMRLDSFSHQSDFQRRLFSLGFVKEDLPPVMSLGAADTIVKNPNIFAPISQAFG
jgi:GNAT superfamily N-acetyltransferase